jgi:predicted ATPase
MADALVRELQLLPPEVDEPRDGYPWDLPVVLGIAGGLGLHPSVTYFVGENGSGKSTLLEAIAVAAGMNPEGGSSNFAFSTRASHSELGKVLRLVRGARRPRTDFFCEPRACSPRRRTLRSSPETAAIHSAPTGVSRSTNNPTANRSWP